MQQRGFSAVGGTLPLLAICAGVILGGFYASWFTLTTFKQKAASGSSLVPEDRLPPMIVGAVSLTVGLFWFAWTSSPALNPWPQILAGVPIGVGVQVILLQALAYLIDMYTTRAASAISGTMIVRSLIGGTFPLFAARIYHELGVGICFPYHLTSIANVRVGFLGYKLARDLCPRTYTDPRSLSLLWREDQVSWEVQWLTSIRVVDGV